MTKLRNTMIDWDEKKDKLKQKFSSLTDRDLFFEKGKIEVMLTKLQDNLGITRHELYIVFSRL